MKLAKLSMLAMTLIGAAHGTSWANGPKGAPSHGPAIHSNAVHSNVMRSNTIHTNVSQSNVVRSNVVHQNNVHQNNVHPNKVYSNNVHPNSVHPNKVYSNNVHPNFARNVRTVPVAYQNWHVTHGRQFSYGFYFQGHQYNQFQYRCWNPTYRCWTFYYPGVNCYYYWSGSSGCYYPLSYATVVAPNGALPYGCDTLPDDQGPLPTQNFTLPE
jgi:hypothetical protein